MAKRCIHGYIVKTKCTCSGCVAERTLQRSAEVSKGRKIGRKLLGLQKYASGDNNAKRAAECPI